MERDRIERTSPATTAASLALLSDPKLTQTSTTQEDELPGQLPSIVETILANRKKLREAAKMGRMYKNPLMKEKKPKRMSQIQKTLDNRSDWGLLPTPGLPLLTEDTKELL